MVLEDRFFVAGHSVGVRGVSHQETECTLNAGQSYEWNTKFKVLGVSQKLSYPRAHLYL